MMVALGIGSSFHSYKSAILILSVVFVPWAMVVVIRCHCHSDSNLALSVAGGTNTTKRWDSRNLREDSTTLLPQRIRNTGMQYPAIAPPSAGYLPPPLDETLADMIEPYQHVNEVPFFWQIPKAGTTFALAYLSRCLNLTLATRKGQYSTDSELKVIEINGYNYMNVDTSAPEGMERAKQLGLASSSLVDVVVSGYVSSAHRVFTPTNRGRLFALFRHPVERLASKFYYLQMATWEKTYRPEIANMTIEQYAQQDTLVVGDWMVRMIVNKLNNIERQPLVPEDLLIAKELLRKKCLVGLLSNMEESIARFEAYFGWPLQDLYIRGQFKMTGDDCKRQYFAGETKENSNKHPKILPGSDAWNLLSKAASYDMQLYSYAVELFEAQKSLFYRKIGAR